MIVLGIDPGTAVTGYGVVRQGRPQAAALIECGVIRTKPRDPLPERLPEIHDGVIELIRRHEPTVLSIEDILRPQRSHDNRARPRPRRDSARGRQAGSRSTSIRRRRSRKPSLGPVGRPSNRCSSW